MTPTRSLTPQPSFARAAVSALLVLAISGCSDSGNDETASAEGSSPAANPPEAEVAGPEADEPRIFGEVVIDGESHALTTVYWCEPEAGYESGTTRAILVAATDASGDVVVYGRQIDREGSDPTSKKFIRATTEHPQNYYNSDRDGREPTLLMESGVARIQGYVGKRGSDPIEVKAEFSLPAEPGFPTEC